MASSRLSCRTFSSQGRKRPKSSARRASRHASCESVVTRALSSTSARGVFTARSRMRRARRRLARSTSPAEEKGLAGQGLAGRVLRALHLIPEAEMLALLDEVDGESRRQRLFYLRDGLEELVRVLALPLVVLPEQLQYLHYVSLTLHAACKRLIALYLADADLRESLLLPPDEEEWLRSLWKPRHRDANPVFGRL